MTSATDSRTTELLSVGDILWNESCDERMVVVAADSVRLWVRKVEKNDKLMMVGGDVWVSLSRKRGVKNHYSQHYAQTVFELDGHVEQAIADELNAALGSGTCEPKCLYQGCEEVIRCRDCKHFKTRNGLGLCKRWKYFSIRSQPDDFCSRAERQDE